MIEIIVGLALLPLALYTATWILAGVIAALTSKVLWNAIGFVLAVGIPVAWVVITGALI